MQFHSLLAQVAPRVSAHFAEQGVEPVLYSTHWFTTILAYSLPLSTQFQHLLRIWDIYMLEGMKVVSEGQTHGSCMDTPEAVCLLI